MRINRNLYFFIYLFNVLKNNNWEYCIGFEERTVKEKLKNISHIYKFIYHCFFFILWVFNSFYVALIFVKFYQNIELSDKYVHFFSIWIKFTKYFYHSVLIFFVALFFLYKYCLFFFSFIIDWFVKKCWWITGLK